MFFSNSFKKLLREGIVLMQGLVLLMAVLCLNQNATANEYVIGAGDRVQVFVWGEPDLSVSALVRPDGRISLPGAGEIMAEGRTSVALQDEITQRLTTLVKDPRVTVSLGDIVNNKVYIIGGGVPTGVYELKQKTSLLQLLASMDLTRADLHGAHVMRDGTRLDRDFESLLHKGDVGQDLDLRHNDIIFFPALPEPYVYVLGAVTSPRSLPFKDGMTVLDAVVECGGFTKFADRNKTVLVRRENGEEKRITVKAADLVEGKDLSQNIVLQRGDYLIANESFF